MAYDMLCSPNFRPGARPSFLPHSNGEIAAAKVYGAVYKEDMRIQPPNIGAGRQRRSRGWDRWGAKGGRKGKQHTALLCLLPLYA